jgi:SAM-dependent methyltransferase
MGAAAPYHDYLCVEPFMADMVGARALSSAFELGVIDALVRKSQKFDGLIDTLRCEPRGLALLLGLLRAGRVVAEQGGEYSLCADFRTALAYRDLMEQKLRFAHLVAPDFTDRLTMLLAEPRRFFEESRLFELFSYQRCLELTPENLAATDNWVRITTALTRYEAAACLAHYDFSPHRRQLDVGGNSGEFVLRICRQHPQLRATVYDLPVVCELGARHVAAEPEGLRIGFAPAQPGQVGQPGQVEQPGHVDLPGGHDLVSFKSMLHDWPDGHAEELLRAAHTALAPGGKVLIFERGVVEVGATQVPYAMVPFLLFFRSYRSVETYCAMLRQLGFRDIVASVIDLDMPFILISASK